MSIPLRVLLVEDSASDAGLTLRQLRRGGYDLDYEVVQTAADLKTALEHGSWDIVISDYAMPIFDAPAALRIFEDSGQDIPFIVVSGNVGEETAVSIMKSGAHDFVSKNNLARLVPAVQRELREATMRRERRQAEEELRLAAQVFGCSREAIMITDPDRKIVSVNRACVEITGYTAEEAVGRSSRFLCAGRHDDRFYAALWSTVNQIGYWQGELWNRRKSGEVYPQWLSITVIRGPGGVIRNYVSVATDITEHKVAEERIHYLAHYDALTDLPNRTLLRERISRAINAAERNRTRLAILFLDLDRFKNINDSLGHHVGDQLLQAVARRLKGCVREVDTVARLGGDEFVIALPDTATDGAAHVAQKFLSALSEPCRVENHQLTVTPSIGISIYPDDGRDIETLIQNADAALYHAKDLGRNHYQFFTRDMNIAAYERMSLESGLRQALEEESFVLHYQPQLDVASGRIAGVEALVRWQHPQWGLVSPGRFIPVAEDSGLIVPIGEWILQEACRQNAKWQEVGLPRIPIAVNLSALQFRHKDLAEVIRRALESSGLESRFLELELTESIIMRDAETRIAGLREISALGVRLTIDDFGTGYSSLSYLKRFPIAKLKIDQSFVRDITTDPDDAAIVSAVITLAHSLRLRVVAEGVETREQFEFLRNAGCDGIQGYYISRPLPVAELSRLLSRHAGTVGGMLRG